MIVGVSDRSDGASVSDRQDGVHESDRGADQTVWAIGLCE